MQVQKPAGKRPDFPVWLLAWDGKSLAGAALKMFTFADACLHKRIVSRIALTQAKDRSSLLGVLYDEVVR